MALINCKECGNKVSTRAASCPKCGAVPQRRQKKSGMGGGCLALGLLGFFGTSLLGMLLVPGGNAPSSRQKAASEAPPKARERPRADRVKEQFSFWDGSHRGLTRLVKDAMNDPDSYTHVETVYWDSGDDLIVKTTFRGKNGFGGVVKNWVKARVDLGGNVLEVLEQGP